MLTIDPVTPESPELEEIKKLYCEAFPSFERSSFKALLHDSSEFYVFNDGDLFVGFASILTFETISHILYISIDGNLRDHGYGSQALQLIRRSLPDQRIVVDIEEESSHAHNKEQRHRRRQFYLRNGFRETGIRYHWRREPYDLLVNGEDISEEEFHRFWHHFKIEGKASEF